MPSISKMMGMPQASSPKWKSPLVFVMGLLFLCFGLLATLSIPYRMHQKSRLDKGVTVPATLLKVEKISSKTISVGYQFSWNSRVIVGDRASIFSRSDDLYHRLIEAKESGWQVPCFVDPNDPSFNALEKDLNLLDFCVLLISLPLLAAGWIYLHRFIFASRNRTQKKSKS